MPHSKDDVKTIVGNDLSGYIHKWKLEEFLESLFGKKIKVYLDNDRYWFYASRKVTDDELRTIKEDERVTD